MFAGEMDRLSRRGGGKSRMSDYMAMLFWEGALRATCHSGAPCGSPVFSHQSELSTVLSTVLSAIVMHLASQLHCSLCVQVQVTFGLGMMFKAERLQRRAHDMLFKGFEWTLLHGEPRNPTTHRYPLTPPCCSFDVSGTLGKCAHSITRYRSDTSLCLDYLPWNRVVCMHQDSVPSGIGMWRPGWLTTAPSAPLMRWPRNC
jgi:hypothetical protein